MLLTYACELGCTGNVSMRLFQMLFAGNIGQPPSEGPPELAGVAVAVNVRVGVGGTRVAVAVLGAAMVGVLVALGMFVATAVLVAVAIGIDVAVAVRVAVAVNVRVAVRVGVRRFGAAFAEPLSNTTSNNADESCKISAMGERAERFIENPSR